MKLPKTHHALLAHACHNGSADTRDQRAVDALVKQDLATQVGAAGFPAGVRIRPTDAGLALIAGASGEPAAQASSGYPVGKIARAKLVMRAVDDYQERPTGQNRGEIRRLLMDLLPDGVGACEPPADSALLDHIQRTGSTVELLPGNRFRIGGLHAAVSTDLRAAIRIAADMALPKTQKED